MSGFHKAVKKSAARRWSVGFSLAAGICFSGVIFSLSNLLVDGGGRLFIDFIVLSSMSILFLGGVIYVHSVTYDSSTIYWRIVFLRRHANLEDIDSINKSASFVSIGLSGGRFIGVPSPSDDFIEWLSSKNKEAGREQ